MRPGGPATSNCPWLSAHRVTIACAGGFVSGDQVLRGDRRIPLNPPLPKGDFTPPGFSLRAVFSPPLEKGAGGILHRPRLAPVPSAHAEPLNAARRPGDFKLPVALRPSGHDRLRGGVRIGRPGPAWRPANPPKSPFAKGGLHSAWIQPPRGVLPPLEKGGGGDSPSPAPRSVPSAHAEPLNAARRPGDFKLPVALPHRVTVACAGGFGSGDQVLRGDRRIPLNPTTVRLT
jgi:hypothetical protein